MGVQLPRELFGVTLVVGSEGLVSLGLDGEVAFVPAATRIGRASPGSVWADTVGGSRYAALGLCGIHFSAAPAPGPCSSP